MAVERSAAHQIERQKQNSCIPFNAEKQLPAKPPGLVQSIF